MEGRISSSRWKVVPGLLAIVVALLLSFATTAAGSLGDLLQSKTLLAKDVPAGFRQDLSVPCIVECIKGLEKNNRVPAGYIGGWSRSFERGGGHGKEQIGSSVWLFGSRAAAHSAFLNSRYWVPTAAVSLPRKIGDEARAYGQTAYFYYVAWRSGRYVGSVALIGRPHGLVTLERTLKLAYQQQRRIRP